MNLKEILDLPIFEEGAYELVVCAPAQLDQEIRWVYMGEISDIARYVHGGELLLTAATGLSPSERGRRRYIREIAEAGVAALVVELGRALRRIPEAMVDEARRRGLVLVALHRDVHWITITEIVHAAIIDRHVELLRQAEEAGAQFTELVLAGAPGTKILEQLANLVERPVLFEDVAHQLVAWAGDPPPELLEHWSAHSWSHHEDPERAQAGLRRGGDPHSCRWLPVTLRNEIAGRIHVIEEGRPLGDLAPLAIDRATVALSLSAALDRRADALGEDARRLLLADARGGATSGRELLSRARTLGARLSGQTLLALVLRLLPEPQAEAAASLVSLPVLNSVLRDVAAVAKVPCISAVDGDRVVALLGVAGTADIRLVASRLADQLDAQGIAGIRGGVSRDSGPAGLSTAFREAEDACQHIISDSMIAFYDDLGLEQLLRPLADGLGLARYVEAELGTLLSHDARTGSALLKTLRVYLETGANKTETARRLHLDRSSLYARLRRLSDLLERDLSDYEQRLRLSVALSALNLIRSSHEAHAPTNLETHRHRPDCQAP